ncbi:MAG TPA: hypothetical protein H9826_06350 [Candidatus Intestinimonas merdavium]|uniref:FtsK domain-containing protein n=1 Tax=Candidatus Intestinimonas merdavium TaxID=2838622 RepID=A0A9D1Z4Z1_9FIRM|nr:hypothetical protein [Candidatus Intestinimonas merdavium]
MKRYDLCRKYHVILIAITLIAALTGWLLRGPVGTALAGVLSFLRLAEQSEIIGACYRIGTGCYLVSGALVIGWATAWCVRHQIWRGGRYALTHAQMEKNVRQALLEAGYGIAVGGQYHRLPCITIKFTDKKMTCAIVKIQNHIKTDASLSTVNLSSALGVYVVDAQYSSDNNNYYYFEISDSRINQQLKFSSYTALADYAKQHTERYGSYTLFMDGRNEGIKIRSLLLVGITGAGKSYALMGLLAQLLNWPIPPIIYYADPKGSDIAVLGGALAPDRTADDIDDIIDLLRAFYHAMMGRKEEMRGKLNGKLSADFTDFQLPAYIFLMDEYAAFQASISKDKKRRDEVEELMRNVVLMGRQLGFFAWIAMQKSDSSDIPTAIRDNLPLKICLGNAPTTTLMTIYGHSADLPSRHWNKGQGLIYCDGITAAPRPVSFPSLNFDIFDALTKPVRDRSAQPVNRA